VNDWLQQVQAQNLRLREQEHTPLFEIQRWAGLGGEALFDSTLVFENYPVSEALEQGSPAGLRFGTMDSLEQTHYPLTVLLAMGDRLAMEFNYDHAAFDTQDVVNLSAHFQQLLLALMLPQVERLADLPSLPAAQRQLIVEDWNATTRDYPLHRGVHQMIEDQVALAPDAPALAFGAKTPDLRRAEPSRQPPGSSLDRSRRRAGRAGGPGRRAFHRNGGGPARRAQGRWRLCAAGSGIPA